ncbi:MULTISPECIES: hypothetical protein [Agrobacterium]|uniref:hypothetical protein n=1 Tax=Agrobacterium TaxID=357 RepID=UPI0009CB3887|nr:MULTISPECIES: hypothetical protein [Agrobacterium]CUX42084.1 conserved hypothetical protein [Agrobacterium sp. NCPPB 925]
MMHVERPGLLSKALGLIAKGLAMLVLYPLLFLFAIVVMAMVVISPEIKPREERPD